MVTINSKKEGEYVAERGNHIERLRRFGQDVPVQSEKPKDLGSARGLGDSLRFIDVFDCTSGQVPLAAKASSKPDAL